MSKPQLPRTPTEIAAAVWMQHPLVIEAQKKIKEGSFQILDSLLFATFAEGAKYATQRCADAGHGERA